VWAAFRQITTMEAKLQADKYFDLHLQSPPHRIAWRAISILSPHLYLIHPNNHFPTNPSTNISTTITWQMPPFPQFYPSSFCPINNADHKAPHLAVCCSKRCLQHPILRYPQFMFLPQYDTPSFVPYISAGNIIRCVRKVAVHLQKLLEVMSKNVYTGLNPN
jgi:hypothetical protein